MARIALLPFGSAGDVFPFIWLGRHLHARGHEVVLVTASLFEEAVSRTGIEFRPLDGSEDFESLIRDPRIWKPGVGTKLVLQTACRAIDPFAVAMETLIAEGRRPDLMLAPLTAMGGRLVREKHGIPMLTVHLQPAAILSAYETPVLAPGMELFRKLPVWFKRPFLQLTNPVDLFCRKLVAQACVRHGVSPPHSVMREWWNSPDGVLALFPEWFAKPQPDWPQPLLQTDFPLEDLASELGLEPGVEAFLASGAPPVIVTAGSANVQAERFFRIAVEALERAGLRGVLASREMSQLPSPLPESILPVAFAPFSRLLPRATAFVHHGGIGTLSQGFAAGVPQLVIPMAHDQPDNAHRLVQLGAGLSLPLWRLSADRLAKRLRRLTTETAFREKSGGLAKRVRPGMVPETVLARVEEILGDPEGAIDTGRRQVL